MNSKPRLEGQKSPVFIDLFAGCGGLSLGLEQAGWEPVVVCELHRDAMATYLKNRRHDFPRLRHNKFHDVSELTAEGVIPAILRNLKQSHGIGEVDLVVGGPPCQGYSGIGHRRTFKTLSRTDMPSNHLFKQMIKVIRAVRPKLFLFENVRGILSGRWTKDGKKGQIWSDVIREFESLDEYKFDWKLIRAKDYGVPQNRPRVILVGIRNDIDFDVDPLAVAGGLLPPPLPSGSAPHPAGLLSDLVDEHYKEHHYRTSTYPKVPEGIQNDFRRTRDTGRVLGRGEKLTEQDYSRHSAKVERKFQHMRDNAGRVHHAHRTKKFAQRVLPRTWPDGGPTITATSLPDDYVHFAQSRSLTVRECARLQTFPDWYRFCGRRTTGGRRRAGDPGAGLWVRDLPKYTQVGNAVPVFLAKAIGSHLMKFVR